MGFVCITVALTVLVPQLIKVQGIDVQNRNDLRLHGTFCLGNAGQLLQHSAINSLKDH